VRFVNNPAGRELRLRGLNAKVVASGGPCGPETRSSGSEGLAGPGDGLPRRVSGMAPPFLIELPADDAERARRFWQGLLGSSLEPREPDEGRGWQGDYEGVVVGVARAWFRPGRPFLAPLLPVSDLARRSSASARSAVRSSTPARAG